MMASTWIRRLRCASTVVVLLTFGAAASLAHMKVSKTAPEDGAALDEAPATVQVWFTQEPDLAVSKMALNGPSIETELAPRAAEGKSLVADIDTPLDAGDYVVSWQTAGDDGHIQKGEVRFTVKASE